MPEARLATTKGQGRKLAVRLSRRQFGSVAAGAGAAVTQLHPGLSRASANEFRSLVAIELAGGNDGWNMVVPIGSAYAAYAEGRGRALAVPRDRLVGLAGSGFGLHPAMAALADIWQRGDLALVLNAGPLALPLTKSLYLRRPDLRPPRALLHDGAATLWEGAVAWLDSTRVAARVDERVDAHFPAAVRATSIGRQLRDAAQTLIASVAQGLPRQNLRVRHDGYDLHGEQVAAGDPAAGRHAALLSELTSALVAFDGAMRAFGLGDQVTCFTLSDFGRAFRGNWERGTEHGWGNVQLVLGGAVARHGVHGTYPDVTPGGPDDVVGDGRFIPALSLEEYLAPLARWYGHGRTDLSRHFANWSEWTDRRRTGISLFA